MNIQRKISESPVGVNQRPSSLNSESFEMIKTGEARDAEFDSFQPITNQEVYADTQAAYDNIRTLLGSYSGGPVSRDLKTSLIASIQTLSGSEYAQTFINELIKTNTYAKIAFVVDQWRLNKSYLCSADYSLNQAFLEYKTAKQNLKTAEQSLNNAKEALNGCDTSNINALHEALIAREGALELLSSSRTLLKDKRKTLEDAQTTFKTAQTTLENTMGIHQTGRLLPYHIIRTKQIEEATAMVTDHCREDLITEGALLIWKEVFGRLPGEKIGTWEELTVRAPCSDPASLEKRQNLRVEFEEGLSKRFDLPQGFEELSSVRL